MTTLKPGAGWGVTQSEAMAGGGLVLDPGASPLGEGRAAGVKSLNVGYPAGSLAKAAKEWEHRQRLSAGVRRDGQVLIPSTGITWDPVGSFQRSS